MASLPQPAAGSLAVPEARLMLAQTAAAPDHLPDRLAQTIVESALDCIIVIDARGLIVEFNPAAVETFGYARAEVLGRPVADLMPAEARNAHRTGLARYLRTGEARLLDHRFETTARRADGNSFPVELTVTRVPRPGPVLLVGFLRDLSECKQTQAELRDSTKRLRRATAERLRLLRRLVAAHEDERRSIAGAIHDDSVQAVAALSLRVSAMRRVVTDPELKGSLLQIEETVSDAISRLRHLIFELHPTTLEHAGLAATVKDHLAQFSQDDGVSYAFVSRLDRDPPPRARLVLFRIIQEAVTNARKHARASTVAVTLEEDAKGFVARIVDDGVGFLFDRVESPAGHLGLSTMRERAEMVHGSVEVESGGGHGTAVEVRVPVEPSRGGK